MLQQQPLSSCAAGEASNGLSLSEKKRQDDTPWTDFLVEHSPEFRGLLKIRQQVSKDPDADRHYEKLKYSVRRANYKANQQNSLHRAQRHMCLKLNQDTEILQILGNTRQPRVLEMGMAKGGFSNSILDCYPDTQITGISMPEAEGGHPVLFQHRNIKSLLRDVGTLAGDVGAAGIPDTHPALASLTTERLLPADEVYDLAFCQEQPVRDLDMNRDEPSGEQQPYYERGPWSDNLKYRRIQTAQLVIAMEHLKEGGTIVVLLRKPESLGTARLLKTFSAFSELSVFKHPGLYQRTPSFLMVAKKVRTRSEEALAAISTWRQEWREMTLGEAGGEDRSEEVEDVHEFISGFGKRLVEMANAVWSIQADGLRAFLGKVREKSKQPHPFERFEVRKQDYFRSSPWVLSTA